MPNATLPQRQIETRAKNKTTHPGKVVKSSQRRTKVEVQQEKDAKAQAKADLAEARQQSINRTAEFEHADITNEDMVNATPRLTFTPKPRPLSYNQKKSPLASFSGDIEASNDLDETPFMSDSESLVGSVIDSAVDETPFMPGLVDPVDSAVESDSPTVTPPPAKKKKAKTIQKATALAAKVDVKKLGEIAERKQKLEVVDTEPESDVPLDSDKRQPRGPKPKRVKVKTRDEINVATTTIFEDENGGNKYAKMVNSMGLSGKPVSKVPSQFQAVGGRQLKREGAIADIKKLVDGKKLNREGAIADITHLTTFNFPDSSTGTRPYPDNNIR
jgi:hypothetical protein